MKTTRKTSRWIGHALGKAWRSWLRVEKQVALWFKKIRVPAILTKIVLRLMLAAGIVKLMYVSGFLTLLWSLLVVGVLIIFFAYVLNNWTPSKGESPSYFPQDEDDPRNELGYDPNFYNDHSHEQYIHEKD